jgi:putative DNA primase/helicase
MAPRRLTLGHLKLTWPDKDGKRDKSGRVLERTVLELRTGSLNLQDVLPPSWHPDIDRRYEWITAPEAEFPTMPEWMLMLWMEWEDFERRARLLCPWLSEAERKGKPEAEGSAWPRRCGGSRTALTSSRRCPPRTSG